MCVWSTGVGINPLAALIRGKFPQAQTNTRALVTDQYLTLLGANNVYAIGDCSTIRQDFMLKQFEQLFLEADANHDGRISLKEFETLVSKKAREFPQLQEYARKAHKLFKESDTDKSGFLEHDEFKACLQKVDSKLKFLPGTAQVADQEGRYLAARLDAQAAKKEGQSTPVEVDAFRYKHLGSLAYVGHDQSVAQLTDKWVVSGYGAWWLWRSVYVSKTVSLKNKIALLTDWLQTQVFGRETS